tara:strand:+ start:10271 stop:12037 length:1767 start_codon:yes stop_codon:yes gene_type:complete
MSIIEKLTEGIVSRNVQKEGQAVLNKWEKTGLLEGLESDHSRNSMAALLENQAKELLREASSMQASDVEGFAAVAFPIVRRVFGGLIANELVSVQPMSLPSGLIFFLDFTYGDTKVPYTKGNSIYGGGKVGNQITGGVDLSGVNAEKSFYALNNGYSSPTASFGKFTSTLVGWGTASSDAAADWTGDLTPTQANAITRYDPDISGSVVGIGKIDKSTFETAQKTLNFDDLITLVVSDGTNGSATQPGFANNARQVRRLTQLSSGSFQGGDRTGTEILFVLEYTGGTATADITGSVEGVDNATGSIVDAFTTSGLAKGAIVGRTDWALENTNAIPEIDIKVDSVSITAVTKKLKAKWTPELQQDINAYHNLDAEVELTGILSETIALEIDQEILEDLIQGASAGTYFWSRKPGKFVARSGTAAAPGGATTNETLYPDFTGTVSEWYETLLETVNDVSAQIHRKTLRGGANFIVTSPEVANVLEFTSGFRADTTADENRGTAGAVKVGQVSKKWDIYVDPYFPRNVLLVGRKGNSFLESGYVYAPYVPLQVTPTIFGPEDFVPRKGVMTRYGKKMVRPDMYGLVIVEDLL